MLEIKPFMVIRKGVLRIELHYPDPQGGRDLCVHALTLKLGMNPYDSESVLFSKGPGIKSARVPVGVALKHAVDRVLDGYNERCNLGASDALLSCDQLELVISEVKELLASAEPANAIEYNRISHARSLELRELLKSADDMVNDGDFLISKFDLDELKSSIAKISERLDMGRNQDLGGVLGDVALVRTRCDCRSNSFNISGDGGQEMVVTCSRHIPVDCHDRFFIEVSGCGVNGALLPRLSIIGVVLRVGDTGSELESIAKDTADRFFTAIERLGFIVDTLDMRCALAQVLVDVSNQNQ
jgi:hypothetical protein